MPEYSKTLIVANIGVTLESSCPLLLERQIASLYPYRAGQLTDSVETLISVKVSGLGQKSRVRNPQQAKFGLVKCPSNPGNNIWFNEAEAEGDYRIVTEDVSGVVLRFSPNTYEFSFKNENYSAAEKVISHAFQQIISAHCAAKHRYLIHASGVETDNGIVLFVGEKRAGKTTCFLDAVLKLDARPFSCDKVYLEFNPRIPEISVNTHPSKFRVLPGTLQKYGERFAKFIPTEYINRDADTYWLGESKGKVSIAPQTLEKLVSSPFALRGKLLGVIFPQIQKGLDSTVRTLANEEAKRLLLANTFAIQNTEFDDWISLGVDRAEDRERVSAMYDVLIATTPFVSMTAAEETTDVLRDAFLTLNRAA